MRKVYMESLTYRHSGISNDILLFSDIGLSLAHHYRVHKKGVPHVAFRKNYMSQLRALLPLPAAPLAERGSPEPGCSSMEDSPEAVGASSRPSRCTFARRRISRVRETPRRVAPRLTELDPLAVAGAMVFDCRPHPQVLPGAMDVSGTELTEIRSMTRASAATASPPEREQSFGGSRFTGAPHAPPPPHVESDGPNFSPEHGVQLNDPRFLEYVGAPESAQLIIRSPAYWVHHMGRANALSAALQLQHDAGLILSNVQVLQQLVTSLCQTSTDVLLAVHGRQPFPSSAVQQVMPSYGVRRAAHYMMAMGLWRPPVDTGIRTPMSSVTCNACTSCQDCCLGEARREIDYVNSD